MRGGVNQAEREWLFELADRQFGPVHEIFAQAVCEGCGFAVVRLNDPDGPLPSWERDDEGRLLCPNCAE